MTTTNCSVAAISPAININDHDVIANIQTGARKRVKMAKVHSLPCTIHSTNNNNDNDRCAVGVYFQPAEIIPNNEEGTTTASTTWAAQFRGRGLIGKEWVLPPFVSGIVLADSGSLTVTEEGERKKALSVEAAFQSITEWGHDEDPSKRVTKSDLITNSGKLSRALDWLELASMVCIII